MIHLTQTAIGAANLKAGLIRDADGYTMTAGGKDVWGATDEAHYAFFEQKGDFDLALRIVSLTMANLYTKAGIMARENLKADSRNLFFAAFGDNGPRRNNNSGCELQYREDEGRESCAIYPEKTADGSPRFPAAFPHAWLRLKRAGRTFTAYYSGNGKDWLVYGRLEMPFAADLLVGVCLTAHDEEALCTCRFADLELLLNNGTEQ